MLHTDTNRIEILNLSQLIGLRYVFCKCKHLNNTIRYDTVQSTAYATKWRVVSWVYHFEAERVGTLLPLLTRKPCYRKDDRAMRPIYIACPENFRQSLSTPTVTFPEIFNGLLFLAILFECAYKI